MKRIAIIGTRGYPYIYSGYETFVRELGERLQKKGFDITVYCHRNLFKKYPRRVNGLRLRYIPSIETKFLSQFIHSFLSFVHAIFCKYDLLLVVNSSNGPFGLITRLMRKKTVINVDGLEWMRPKWKGLGAKYFRFASRLATRFYNRIVTDSSEMQKVYQREFQSNSTMIAYGANIEYSANASLIEKWNLKRGQYFLIVGRLIPDNNGATILEEFKKSSTRKKLVVVGDVPYKDEYARKIKACTDERVVFTGYITDQEVLAELYLNCFVYLHGHEYGGTNPALLKALACGCAVCALNTPFTREMLDKGLYGLFFRKEKGNLRGIIDRLDRGDISMADYRKLARNRVKDYYNWDKITQQYIDLFFSITAGKQHDS